MKTHNKTLVACLALALLTAFSGCAGMSDTQQRTMTGSLGGAAAGAAIGAIAGNAGLGAAIGAGAGALGGYAYGKHKESVNRAYEQGRRDAGR
ncbi:YMGG-like glycine zipper-containing protein [Methylococcus sp. EFPC2]|uniref:YMGG-like glycine zipper-containing protein n=1 Tax=Methylococcus sp. EFPC2 TaxID=2812648 RepID=UPI001967F2A0|nr:glycine zipper domain-containing protein [Methylococcus sp. EFPC2]QSA97784.1 hypothetical protein JWZ97_02840 [Methylococcus sp. EFPC2]